MTTIYGALEMYLKFNEIEYNTADLLMIRNYMEENATAVKLQRGQLEIQFNIPAIEWIKKHKEGAG